MTDRILHSTSRAWHVAITLWTDIRPDHEDFLCQRTLTFFSRQRSQALGTRFRASGSLPIRLVEGAIEVGGYEEPKQ